MNEDFRAGMPTMHQHGAIRLPDDSSWCSRRECPASIGARGTRISRKKRKYGPMASGLQYPWQQVICMRQECGFG
jgi:hypothetical protein